MEDNTLEEAVANFSVSQIPNDTSAPHPRFSLYKQKLSASSQAERRKLYLENQKIKRYDYQSKFRNLVYDDVSEPSEESMDFTVEKLAKKKRINKKYRDQLMLSEWLVEVPDDLCDNWMMLLCPVGKRTLVEASHGTTKSFSRSGFCVNHGFPSHLPGGHKKQRSSHGLTLLDCIFDEKKRIYFILDVICWNGHYVYESDTEFRFYWIKTKLEEIPDLNEKSNSNPYPFHALDASDRCSEDEIKRQISKSLPFQCELDGVLFYHKTLSYIPGVTPLVGWLKGYMLPEIVGIDVPDSWKSQAPSDYISLAQHRPNVVKNYHLRKTAEAQKMES